MNCVPFSKCNTKYKQSKVTLLALLAVVYQPRALGNRFSLRVGNYHFVSKYITIAIEMAVK